MRSALFLIVVLVLLSFGASQTTAQCSCVAERVHITAREEFKLAYAVFVGKVLNIQKSDRDKDDSYVQRVTFEVTKAWKHDVGANLVVTNKIQGCVKGFNEYEEWLVYAYKNEDGTLGTFCCCTRTMRLAEAAEDLKAFPEDYIGASGSGLSQESDGTEGTIFVGRRYSFILKEPPGWVMNSETGNSQGVAAVLYPKGSSWKEAVTVMYARVIDKDETQPTIEKVISEDIAEMMKLNKESKVSDSLSIKTGDKKESTVKVFYDAANKNYESVAFIDEPKVVVILALSSRDKLEYEKSLPAFQALVGSYFVFKPLVDPR